MQAGSGAAVKPFDAEENWTTLTAYCQPGCWNGWVGLWGLYGLDGVRTKAWHAVRTFSKFGDTLQQTNVYDTIVRADEPGKLRGDGCYEKTWRFTKEECKRDDGWWHPYTTESGPMRSRVLGTALSRTVTPPFALPAAELFPVPEEETLLPFWSCELFIRPPGTPLSWSAGPVFDSKTGALLAVFYIQEAQSHDNPLRELTLTDRPELPLPRAPLPALPADWPGTSGAGVAQEIHWDADGSMWLGEEQPAKWVPPAASQRVTLLPDAMYASFPEAMPTKLADIPEVGVTVEAGGVVLGREGFHRRVLHYGRNGRISSVRFEEFATAA